VDGAAVTAAAFTGGLVVDLRDDATEADVRAIETRFGVDLEPNSIHAADEKLLRADVADASQARRIAEALRRDGGGLVETAEPEVRFAIPEGDTGAGPVARIAGPVARSAGAGAATAGPRLFSRGFVPNDPRYPEQWNLRMVGAEKAWTRTRGANVVVAVIDTGVAGRGSAKGKQARDFGQTRFAHGYDFVHNDDDPYDDHGHGTHVAGTIAEATDNREGVAGLAFEATILPIKVLSAQGSGTSTDVADAIRFAADRGAGVINLSLGSPFPSEVVHQAVRYAARKGVVVACAAGNGFGEGVSFPAAFPECIAVSSVGPDGALATYSSWGKEIALAAPGGDMLKTERAQDGILQNTILSPDIGGRGDDYYHFQGTSMAAPHVAAAAALVKAQGVRDPAEVRDLLAGSARPKPDRLRYGAGILSADGATRMGARQAAAARTKQLLFGALAAMLFWFGGGGFGGGIAAALALRAGLVAALGAGCFGPEWLMGQVGANSAWNLAGWGALAPFWLFWEWEDPRGRRLVAALALGVALCLACALLPGGGSAAAAAAATPFTADLFGQRPLPWIATNLMAALALAAAAWKQTR
jgi:serine protease